MKFDSKSDAETAVVPFGLKLSQMGLSLSSPNLRTATSLFSSSDSDEGSANEGSDKSKTSVDHRHHPHDEFTSIDGNEETISGENDVEYAEFSMVHQVPAHVEATTADGSNETPTLNEEMMFLRLFDDLQPQGATAVNDNKNFTAHSKFFRFDVTNHTQCLANTCLFPFSHSVDISIANHDIECVGIVAGITETECCSSA